MIVNTNDTFFISALGISAVSAKNVQTAIAIWVREPISKNDIL